MRLWFKPSFAGPAGFFGGRAAFCAQAWHRRAHAARHDAEHPKQRFIARAAARLGLDADQQALLAALVDRLREQRDALRGATDWRSELHGLVEDESFDRWRAQDLLNARIQALREQGPAVIESLAAFYDGLTPAQQAELRRLIGRDLWR